MKLNRSSKVHGRALAAASLILLSFFVIPQSFAASEQGPEIALETKIVSATVYSNEVQVTRRGKTEARPGLCRLYCDDLPPGFSESSLQVEGRGGAAAAILGIDIVRLRENPAETPKYKELKAKLELLIAEKDSLEIGVNSLKKRLEFLGDLAKLPMAKWSEEISGDIFRVQDWKNLADFLESDGVGAERRIHRLVKSIEKLKEEIAWINGEMNAIRRAGGRGRRVVIDCDVTKAGSLTIDLTYIVPDASWSPEYTVRYAAAAKEIGLAYGARIRQSTGENWEGVSLSLSTARPRIGAAPPRVRPYFVARRKPPLVRGMPRDKKAVQELAAADRAAAEGILEAETPSVEMAESRVFASEFAANFEIPRPVDLPSGAEPRRLRIMEEKLKGEISRYTAPRFSQNVFIGGRVRNSLEVPLLPGPAEVYIELAGPGGRGGGTNFVGRESIGPVVAGEDFDIHLGVDQDVKAGHERLKKEYVSKEGKSQKKIRYHYLITLESFKKSDLELTLQDRIPVSTMKEIKIEDVELEPRPDEKGDDGIITWKLTLAPGVKQEVRISYTVAFPGDWPEREINLE